MSTPLPTQPPEQPKRICTHPNHIGERFLTLDNFSKRSASVDGYQNYCKACMSAYYRKSPHKARQKKYDSRPDVKKRMHEHHLMRKYNMTQEDYDKMFAEQNGKCKICGREASTMKIPLVVDHDHDTGKPRGLLCSPCNYAVIGGLDWALKVVQYLREAEATNGTNTDTY